MFHSSDWMEVFSERKQGSYVIEESTRFLSFRGGPSNDRTEAKQIFPPMLLWRSTCWLDSSIYRVSAFVPTLVFPYTFMLGDLLADWSNRHPPPSFKAILLLFRIYITNMLSNNYQIAITQYDQYFGSTIICMKRQGCSTG